MPPVPKGSKRSPEVIAKIKESCAKSAKHKAATERMLSDPDRMKKIAKALKPLYKQKAKEREQLKRKAKKLARSPIGRLVAVDTNGNPRYTALWVSQVEPGFTLTIATAKVIKFGRPRDPWGNFMKPVHPEYIFGMPLRNGEELVHPPKQQTSVPKPAGGAGVDATDGANVAGASESVGKNTSLARRIYQRYHRGQ